MSRARLIAIDWGTSNLRASLLGDGGALIATRTAAGGVMAVPERRFAETLQALCGDWIEQHACPAIASGMVGSRQGWQEAPYLACPASLAQVAGHLTRIGLTPQVALHVVPGLRCVGADGQDDVMRGEETQLWGAALPADQCCVLPGTHSKWAWMGEAGEIGGFQTFMTGELYGLLTQHGILGRLMQFGHRRPQAFDQGVQFGLAEHAIATHAIFAARTAGLMNRVEPEGLPDFLSGILIGIEIGSARRGREVHAVTLLGDDTLCQRYEAALAVAGIGSTRAVDDATTRGQWRVALAAGLVEGTA